MARPIRIQSPGLWHHVMGRGLARGALFLEDEDRELFYELLTDVRERWGLCTHAACLMDNHFHLLVEDADGTLARAMRHVIGVYTQRFNGRHGRGGPLMRGRFRSRLVQRERYLAELVRHIHMNPVQAKRVARAGDHPWSSHRHYLAAEPPPWLVTGEVMRRFGGDVGALDAFVHARLPAGERQALRWSTSPSILGDAAFQETWSARLRPDRTQAAAASGRGLYACDQVIAASAACFGTTRESVASARRGEFNTPRQVAVLVCVDHTRRSSREIGAAFGMTPRSLSTLAARYRRRLDEDARLRGGVRAVLEALHASGGAGKATAGGAHAPSPMNGGPGA
ncbi:MAG: transposase [Deltaproteobacteria bacterium]|nr:transposase [Deltaproteobacteria bacterium]